MYKIAICDDDKKIISQLNSMLENTLYIGYSVMSFEDEEVFLDMIKSGEIFDIVILDIILKDDLGINIAKVVNHCLPKSSVIFISYTTDYIQEMYESNHLYFLKKPICPDKFKIAINKAIKQLERQFLMIEKKGQLIKVYINDILFLESSVRQVKIYSVDEIVEHYIKLSEIEKLLPEPNFIRCHKSYIVNLDYVNRIDKMNIVLNNNMIIPISKGFVKKFKQQIANYFLKDGNIYV